MVSPWYQIADDFRARYIVKWRHVRIAQFSRWRRLCFSVRPSIGVIDVSFGVGMLMLRWGPLWK